MFLLEFVLVGGHIRIKTHSFNTTITISDNVFERGMADWGAFFSFEVCFSVYAENNIFLYGTAKSYFGTGVGSGAIMVLTGISDFRYSVFIGSANKYMFGWGENRGHSFYFV